RDQDLSSQVHELMGTGCAKVFKEKVSGANTDRAELAKVIGRLEPDDVLVVTRLDRLARSTRDLLNVIDAVTKRGAGFRSLKDTWADTLRGRCGVTVRFTMVEGWRAGRGFFTGNAPYGNATFRIMHFLRKDVTRRASSIFGALVRRGLA